MVDLILEGNYKTNTTRVIPLQGGGAKVEASGQGQVKFLGTDSSDIFTYTATPRIDGTLWGEGSGVTTTKDGDTVTWRGYGVGAPDGRGGTNWKAAFFFFNAMSQKFSDIGRTVGRGELEIDAMGNIRARIWNWT